MDWRVAALSVPGQVPVLEAQRELRSLGARLLRTGSPAAALKRMGAIVDVTGDLPGELGFWKDLHIAMDTEPAAVLQLLLTWVKRLQGRSYTPGRREAQLRGLWRTGLDADDQALVDLAAEAVNRASAAGYYQFLDLLPAAVPEPVSP